MSVRNVAPEKASFLRYELENGDDRRKKVALQEIARVHRFGGKFASDSRNGLELTINGLLSAEQDDKVTRWCLNCIAQMGTRDGSMQSVERALRQHIGSPEIIGAAAAAAARLYSGQLELCSALGSIQPEIRTLAALQVVHPSKLNLSGFKINIEQADDEVLKLALITIGLNRAFENMFHPRHANSELVRILGHHDNNIIKQYSVWSIIENTGLNIDSLGIPFDKIESQSPNVQAKMLQLAAEQIVDLKYRQEIISKGSHFPDADAREGLAKGLQNVFYDGLQDITLDWFGIESSLRVKELLAEHFARYGNNCMSYQEKALEILESEPHLKRRLYLGAEGTALFAKLKSNDLREGMGDLFGDQSDPIIAKLIGMRSMKVKKILMMCASPTDADRLRLDQEVRDLKEQLRLVDNQKQIISIEYAWATRTDQIQMEVLNSMPEVLHFSGHGDTGHLYFESKDGNAAPVSGAAIKGLVKLSQSVDCVVMNACFSDSIASELSPYVKAVIGCRVSIGDDAAVVFTKAFYRALAHDVPYRRAFDLALNEMELSNMENEAKKYSFVEGSAS